MKTEKETRLSIRMSSEELESLKRIAAMQDKTLADWVRETLLVQSGYRDDKLVSLERRIALLEARLGVAS